MMAINSRSKGNKQELLVCRILSDWWKNAEMEWDGSLKGISQTLKGTLASDMPFRRSPMSGGWDKKKASGDLLVPKKFPFSVEIKAREKWSFKELLSFDNQKAPLNKYWQQTNDDAEAYTKYSKIPMLIFTKNTHTYYVRMNLSTFKLLKVNPTIRHKDGTGYTILHEFLSKVTKSKVKKVWRELQK